MYRLDELMAAVSGDSLSSFSQEFTRDCSAHNKTVHLSTSSFRHTTNSSRFTVSDPHHSPSYDYTLHRQRDNNYSSKSTAPATAWKRLGDADKTQTVSKSTSESEVEAVQRDLREKLAAVKVVLMVLDALLLLHRVVSLCFDVQCLNANISQSQAAVNATKLDVDTVTDDKQNVIQLKTTDVERLVDSQSERSWLSCDHRTCCRGELVVVVVCAGASLVVLLPVMMLSGPTDAGLVVSRLILPNLSDSTSVDHNGHVDSQWSSADTHRQHVEFELRQILSLRQMHGMMMMKLP